MDGHSVQLAHYVLLPPIGSFLYSNTIAAVQLNRDHLRRSGATGAEHGMNGIKQRVLFSGDMFEDPFPAYSTSRRQNMIFEQASNQRVKEMLWLHFC